MPTVNLRFVTGAQRTLDLAPDATVTQIKNILAEEFMRETLRVCHKGEVLEDDRTVESMNLGENDKLIITGRKNTAAPQPTAAGTAPAPSATATPSAPFTAPTKAAAPQAPAAAGGGGITLDPEALAALEGMGFSKAEAMKALRAAYNNAERAVEYLLGGIPPAVLQQLNEPVAPPPARPSAPSGGSPAGRPAGGSGLTAQNLFGGGGGRNSDELRQRLTALPQFPQMLQLVRENPSVLPEIVQQIRVHHPDIFQLIAAQPNEFAAILGLTAAGQGGQGGQGGQNFRARSIEDEEPIQRLVAMGGGHWDDRAAALVYIISDRNEEAAANVLIDNNGLPDELRPALEQFKDQLAPPSQ